MAHCDRLNTTLWCIEHAYRISEHRMRQMQQRRSYRPW